MDNTIQWAPKALKQTRRLDRDVKTRIYDAVQALTKMPEVQNVKALAEHRYGFRLRVGDYRVLFDWDGAIRIVEVQEVKVRSEHTY